ncbi:MAG: GDP-mannose 4,6-dehydratase [Cyanobacteria bacterium P01_F01_bin.33]
MSKVAFITGVSGQDGSYLADLLLTKGYLVHGTVRRASSIERPNLEHLINDCDIYNKRLFLHYADLSDLTTLRRLVRRIMPQEFYHFAGQSHVGLSFEIPESTCDFTAMGTLRILELLRDLDQPVRFLNVGSSEIFGAPKSAPQSEETPYRPVSPYGVAKAFAVNMVRIFRESHGMFAVNAISFNHESPRRGRSFVTRKIARAAAEISLGKRKELVLGNIQTKRDWGYAPEYVEGMWRLLQADTPSDYVLATGRLCSLENFLASAFAVVDLDWRNYLHIDDRFIRPNDPDTLCGDPTKIGRDLGWFSKTGAEEVAEIMVRADLKSLQSRTD